MWRGISWHKLEIQQEQDEVENPFMGVFSFYKVIVSLNRYVNYFLFRKVYGDQAKYYEAENLPILKHTKLGVLSMVNVGDNM